MIACDGCGGEQQARPSNNGTPKLPPTWKRVGSETLCKSCRAATWKTRAVTLGLYVPDTESQDRKAVWERLHQSWDAVGRAANAAMRTLVVGDPCEQKPTKNGRITLEKLPSGLANDAYHAARAASPALSSSPVADICQRVYGRYQHDRWAIQQSCRKSAPRFPGPLPLSIRTKDWQLVTRESDDGRVEYFVRFPLMDLLRDQRPICKLIIKTGRDAHLLQRIATDEWPRGTLEILCPGWDRKRKLKAKIVYQKRVSAGSETAEKVSAGTAPMQLRTDVDRFWVGAAPDDERPRHWNLDWLRSKIRAYEMWRLRKSEDLKHERRIPKGRRGMYREDVGKRADKHASRVRTALQQVCAQVVGVARRSGCNVIEYNDAERGWCEKFPWHQVRMSLLCAVENVGLEVRFTGTDGDVSDATG